jgi:hypothetical protein
MFSFIAKHRAIWPAAWLCGALGVSRGGFYPPLAAMPKHSSKLTPHKKDKTPAPAQKARKRRRLLSR